MSRTLQESPQLETKHRRGKMALLVLHSLLAQHEMYFYWEIRRRYMDHMISLSVPLANRSSTAGDC